jgi:hypothetical protein
MRADGFETLARDQIWSSAVLGASEACLRLGEVGPAGELLALIQEAPDALAYNGLVCLGAMGWAEARCLTVLGRTEEADAAFARAEAHHERIGAASLTARTRVERAAAGV